MPDAIGSLFQRDLCRLGLGVGRAVETELDPRRMLRKQREIDALAVPGRSELGCRARPNAHRPQLDRTPRDISRGAIVAGGRRTAQDPFLSPNSRRVDSPPLSAWVQLGS